MFCASHSIPHEDCGHCRKTLTAMRPSVFAELAAVEVSAGTVCCLGCDLVYREALAACPRCARTRGHLSDGTWEPAASLEGLTLRELSGA